MMTPRSNPVSVVKLLAAIAAVMALGACGGSADAPLAGTPPTDTPLTGTFIDSPVEGIGYRTESIASGATDSQGQFSYLAGESVTFFIGDLDFPTTPAVEVVTPFDLAGTTDVTDPTVINIARLLQSLDENGNPDDGITIPDVAAAVATQIDFSKLPADFEADALNFIANAGSVNVSLISEAEAIAHLTDSVLTPVGGTEVWGANGGTIGFVATDSSQQQAADLGRISGTEVVLVYPFVSNTGFYRITNLVWNQGDDSIRMYNRASADSCDPALITMMDTHISQTPEINGGGATSIVVDHGSFFELITPNLEGDSPPVTNDLWIEGACTPGAIQEDRVSVTRLILQGYGTPFTTQTSTARVIEDATGTVVTAAPGDLHFWSVGGFDFFVEFTLPEPNPLTPREDLPITLEIPFSFNGLANCSPVGPNDVWVVDVIPIVPGAPTGWGSSVGLDFGGRLGVSTIISPLFDDLIADLSNLTFVQSIAADAGDTGIPYFQLLGPEQGLPLECNSMGSVFLQANQNIDRFDLYTAPIISIGGLLFPPFTAVFP